LDPLPDRYDFLATINNKAVEYLSAGLPVISSPRRGVLYDLLKTESCGLSYVERGADELAATLQNLQADPVALAGMSVRAQTVFHRHFSANEIHKRMTEYLIEVAARTSRPASVRRCS
jgi:glycosyltransferase involved in cell wall biosynthesis